MAKNDTTGGHRKSARSAGVKPSPDAESVAAAPFDVWLNRGLHQLYDDVAREPIPEELLRLIEADRNRADAGHGPSGGADPDHPARPTEPDRDATPVGDP